MTSMSIESFRPDDPAIVDHFHEHGWVLTDDLEPSEVVELRQWVDEIASTFTVYPSLSGSIAEAARRLHIAAESMVSDYIPAAVAEIGEEWHEDRIDILEATVATSRMQNLLRELGRAWSADGANPEMSGSVLMVVPETEQHTLGAMIATTQMRRMGISVAVQLLASRARLEETLRERRFDAVFMSVGNLDSIDLSRKLVSTARDMLGDSARIAVGGAVPVGPDDLRRMTGADLATRDVAAALQQFELVKPTAAAV